MEKKQTYQRFFEDQNGPLYDETLGDLVPNLHDLTETSLIMLLNVFKQQDSIKILDIGAGTGRDCLTLASVFPQAEFLAIDSSDVMLDGFRQKLRASENATKARKIELIHNNFLEPTNNRLLTGNGFDAIVTSFTFHHFSKSQKKDAYLRAYQLLKTGGLFINTDLFSFESGSISKIALDYDLEFISKNINQRVEESSEPTVKKSLGETRDSWLDHYKTMNITEPIEGDEGQLAILRKCGFVEVCCPFRHWQVGVIAARKTK